MPYKKSFFAGKGSFCSNGEALLFGKEHHDSSLRLVFNNFGWVLPIMQDSFQKVSLAAIKCALGLKLFLTGQEAGLNRSREGDRPEREEKVRSP
jgi:hypothetical protein